MAHLPRYCPGLGIRPQRRLQACVLRARRLPDGHCSVCVWRGAGEEWNSVLFRANLSPCWQPCAYCVSQEASENEEGDIVII